MNIHPQGLHGRHYQALQDKLVESRPIVAICGLGYVGLPLAMAIAARNLRVIGFDIDAEKTDALSRGRSYLQHIGSEMVGGFVEKGLFSATRDFTRIVEADAVIICVPTPLTPHREPDLSYVVDTATAVADNARPGQLIVLESTTYPGTTTDVIKPIFAARGYTDGEDVFLAFSPEREDPGNERFETSGIPKVVGADHPRALDLVKTLYALFIDQVVPVSSSATAEAVKLTENIFRAVNIALMNELKLIYTDMGIDVWEVIDAAKTKPFGFMPFYPGPGVGGHCIPIDPFYLTWRAREFGITTHFIELAGEINNSMPHYVVQRLAEALDKNFRTGLNGARVLIFGVAYKKNVADIRGSASFKLIELLQERGAIVDYYDPYVPIIPLMREHAALAGRRSVELTPDCMRRYDAAVVATDHSNIDYAQVIENSRLVVDTRNACANLPKGPAVVVKA